jgi:hypothetical protein
MVDLVVSLLGLERFKQLRHHAINVTATHGDDKVAS